MAHVGLMVVWCGMGWTGLALGHLLAHALVRCWQILRAPSVRLEGAGRLHRLASVLRLADDLDVVQQLEEAAQAAAHHAMVVGQQHADAGRSGGVGHDPRCVAHRR